MREAEGWCVGQPKGGGGDTGVLAGEAGGGDAHRPVLWHGAGCHEVQPSG